MNRPKNMLIGEMLLEEGIITKEQLKDGLEEQKRTGEKIGIILTKMGYISKEILWTFLGYQMGVPFINLDEIPDIKDDVLRLLPEQLMRNEKLIPVSKQGKVITVAMADPLNFLVVDDLKATTRSEIDARLSPEEDIKGLLNKYFGYKEEDTGEIAKAQVDELDDIMSAPIKSNKQEAPQLKIQRSPYGSSAPKAPAPPPPPPPPQPQAPPPVQEPAYTPPPAPVQNTPSAGEAANMNQAVMSGDTPVNSFLTSLLSDAYDAGSTDIHVEPMADKCRIRRRIDGVLSEIESPPKTLYNGILNKLKELARMNVNERSMPQESKLKIRVSGKEINMAIYTFPTLFGEKITLKIIRADQAIVSIDSIGMDEKTLEYYRHSVKSPFGLILLAGPTNSGKTTTMYSTLAEINTQEVNIFSIDDTSSNYIVPGINQTKVNRKNYGQVLRYLSEQECDTIALGDMHDKEVAEAVFDIIASGHLVLSKIRANNPYQAMQATVNLGIESYVVYSNVVAILSQRLVRRICPGCKEPYEATDDIVKLMGGSSKKVTLYRGRGCQQCSDTGYKGRTAVFEMLYITEKIKDMLINKEIQKKIRDENSKSGLPTIKEAALMKVVEGITTVEEYMKIT